MTPTVTPDLAAHLMDEAIAEARNAAARGEVPVGAVVAYNGAIIGRGSNTTEQDRTVLGHAETHAIKEAAHHLGNWRLEECILCVTLEPCTMCCGAIRLARVPVVIFGAGDSKQGAMGSLYDLSQDPRMGTPVRVVQGIKKNECAELLQQFFKEKRKYTA